MKFHATNEQHHLNFVKSNNKRGGEKLFELSL